eukprot:TRINITY_DN17710_c0_g1_i1.p1 TRINITY_DN17710_c0_g1~~TRINITY_DN17710_c0_g1_i1.p1  ORF type:complete len:181 (+),score=30.92 TRINITY_DN17710_c0_g1_i1:51-593(+)
MILLSFFSPFSSHLPTTSSGTRSCPSTTTKSPMAVHCFQLILHPLFRNNLVVHHPLGLSLSLHIILHVTLLLLGKFSYTGSSFDLNSVRPIAIFFFRLIGLHVRKENSSILPSILCHLPLCSLLAILMGSLASLNALSVMDFLTLVSSMTLMAFLVVAITYQRYHRNKYENNHKDQKENQ